MIAPYAFIAGEWDDEEIRELAKRIPTWPLSGYRATVPVLHVLKYRAHGKTQYEGEVLGQVVHTSVFSKWLDQIELLYLRAVREGNEA